MVSQRSVFATMPAQIFLSVKLFTVVAAERKRERHGLLVIAEVEGDQAEAPAFAREKSMTPFD